MSSVHYFRRKSKNEKEVHVYNNIKKQFELTISILTKDTHSKLYLHQVNLHLYLLMRLVNGILRNGGCRLLKKCFREICQ